MEPPVNERLLRRVEVEQRVGLKTSSIYQKIAKGTFPKPIRLGGTSSVRWRESDINEWIAQCADDEHVPRPLQPALSAAKSRKRKTP
jgi:predicted DNA-binding transcriptional regulator AlpA